MPGSTTLNGIPVLDAGSTPFPLDEGSLAIGSVPANNSSRISFRVVAGMPPRGVYAILSTVEIQTELGLETLVAESEVAGTLVKASVDKAAARSGDTLTYTLTTDYVGGDLLQNVVITAAIPAGTSYVPGSANAGGGESGGVVTWDLGGNQAGVAAISASGPASEVALDNVSTGTASSGLTFNISHATAGTDRLMLVGVSIVWQSSLVSGVSYAGQPLTRVGVEQISPSNNGVRTELWALVNPPVGDDNVAITFNSDMTNVSAGVVTFTGVNQSDPYGPFYSIAQESASVSLTIPSAVGELAFDTISYHRRDDTYAPDSGQTQVWKRRQTDAAGGASSKPGAATVTMGWSGDNVRNWAMGAVSVKPTRLPSLGNGLLAAPTLVTAGDLITVTQVLTASTSTPATTGSTEARISSGNDDAEEAGPDATGSLSPGDVDRTSSDIELTSDADTGGGYSGGTQKIGLRFNNLAVPQGATITNAYLRFRAIAADSPNTNNNAASLTVRGQAADNPTAFATTAYDITNRITTTASVAWTPSSWTHRHELRHAGPHSGGPGDRQPGRLGQRQQHGLHRHRQRLALDGQLRGQLGHGSLASHRLHRARRLLHSIW